MLYILPNLLDPETDPDESFPPSMKKIVCSLSALVAESEKAARRFLALFMNREAFSKIRLLVLNEHSTKEDIREISAQVSKEERCGLISDCGLPCLADPGSNLIFELRKKKVKIEVVSGPSSIVSALLLSGLGAQRFCFHGYLPREIPDLKKKLLELQLQSRGATQMWIEAPYRSQKMLMIIMETLHPKTHLCVAKNLSLSTERVTTQSIHDWKREKGFFDKKEPAVFLISSEKSL